MTDNLLCRTCNVNFGTLSIFEHDDSDLTVIHRFIYCCPNISINKDDGFASHICGTCDEELTRCYNFIQQCEKTDKFLREQTCNILGDDALKVNIKVEDKEDDCNSNVIDFSDNISVKSDVSYAAKCDIEISIDSLPKKRKYRKRNKKPIEKLKCQQCGRTLNSISALKTHQRVHTSERPYSCSLCDKKYKDSGTLKRHTERKHFGYKRIRNFVCEECGKAFFSKTEVQVHIRTHTGETPYACPLCPKKFTQLSAVIRHKRRHNGVKDQICTMCNKSFLTKDELRTHHKVHTKEKSFVCHLCNAGFKYRNNLKTHIKQHTGSNSFICNYCGRSFNLKGNLVVHINNLHSEKSGFCSQCGKSVPNMEVHMWRHNGQRPLNCEFCSSSFYRLNALTHHINFKHKNANKFKCAYEGCTMSFPQQVMLDFHIAKKHDSRVPFSCDRCPRGFYRKNDLARHKLGTHKERLTA